MLCLACGNETNAIKTVRKNGQVVRGCDSCLPYQVQQGDSAKFNREWQKTEYRKDLLQPNQTDFVRAYGAETAKGYGYDDETIRRLS